MEGAYLVVALGEHDNMKTNQVRFDYIIYTIDQHTQLISWTNIRRYQNLENNDFKMRRHAGGYIDFVTNVFDPNKS